MTKLLQCILLAGLCFCVVSCDGCKDTPVTEEEQSLTISLDPDPGNGITKSLSTTYNLTLTVTSKLPSKGVDITMVCKKENDNSRVDSLTLPSTSKVNSVAIRNLPPYEICTVDLQVKSVTKSSNTVSRMFRVVKK